MKKWEFVINRLGDKKAVTHIVYASAYHTALSRLGEQIEKTSFPKVHYIIRLAWVSQHIYEKQASRGKK